ncbi:MAG TPA: hypothetical protein VF074_08060, partial [Pyrinomonadaceae bacterium]
MSLRASIVGARAVLFACFLLLTLATVAFGQQASTRSASNTENSGATSTPSAHRAVPNPKYTTPTSPLDTAYGAKIA